MLFQLQPRCCVPRSKIKCNEEKGNKQQKERDKNWNMGREPLAGVRSRNAAARPRPASCEPGAGVPEARIPALALGQWERERGNGVDREGRPPSTADLRWSAHRQHVYSHSAGMPSPGDAEHLATLKPSETRSRSTDVWHGGSPV